MSSTPFYQHTFRISKQDVTPTKPTSTQVQKRNRPTLSCLPCKNRKLKCDRQQPCQTCAKRGAESPCTYLPDPRPSQRRERDVAQSSEAQQRLQRLEQMVSSLVAGRNASSSPIDGATAASVIDSRPVFTAATGSPAQLPTPPPLGQCRMGHFDKSGYETQYYGVTHWASLLEDIRSVQQYLQLDDAETAGANDQPIMSPPSTSKEGLQPEPDLAFGMPLQPSSGSLLDSLPPKHVMDNLLSMCFNTRHIKAPIIHCFKFQREYERFVEDPSQTSSTWLSILYSLLFLACQIAYMSGRDVGMTQADATSFRLKAKQALANGEYRSGIPYSLEAILMLAVSYFYSSSGPNSEAWIIMGVAARLGMKLGYHRDPTMLPKMSPFEAEMRRRAFFQIEAFDLLLSVQNGLPTIIHEEECDTAPPGNLFDSDFDEDSTSVPPSRPETDATPMLFFRYKSRLCNVYRRIYRRVLSPGLRSYDEIMRLDREMHVVQEGIPPPLRMHSVAGSITDESYLILQRTHCEQMYLKGLCILHRYYLSHGRDNPGFEYSRRTCTDAALRLLKLQADIHFTCQPGAKFSDDGWVHSSITAHDFLLAAMVASVDLNETHVQDGHHLSEEQVKAQVAKHDALNLAQQIWRSKSDSNTDAKRAVKVLNAMLAKVPRPTVQDSLPTPQSPAELSKTPKKVMRDASSAPEMSYGAVGMTEMSGVTSMQDIDAILNDTNGIDWSLLDQYVLSDPEPVVPELASTF